MVAQYQGGIKGSAGAPSSSSATLERTTAEPSSRLQGFEHPLPRLRGRPAAVQHALQPLQNVLQPNVLQVLSLIHVQAKSWFNNLVDQDQ